MSPKKADFQQRKDMVLAIVVDEYIKSTEPVGSNFIVEHYKMDVSPATVRNILAELEEEGYLTHPHTSAGRIPTQQGYRYFVDHLMDEIQLLEAEKNRIEHEYHRGVHELETMMEMASEVISDITHYTSIVSVDGWGNKMICRGTSFVVNYPDQQDIKKIQAILHALEEKERILNLINRSLEHRIEIYIGHEMSLKGIDTCSLAVARFQNKGAHGRIAVLGPTRMDYERVVSALDYISQLMSKR